MSDKQAKLNDQAGAEPAEPGRRRFLIGSVGALVGVGLLAAAPATMAARKKNIAVGVDKPWEPVAGSGLKVGVGRADITPPKGARMAGRKGKAKGSYQSLYVKAMAMDNKGARVVWVCADIAGWGGSGKSGGVVHVVRERLACGPLKLSPAQVILNATRTHCGPALEDKDYAASLVDQTVKAVEAAFTSLEPARLFFEIGKAGFAVSGRAPDDRGYTRPAINPFRPVDQEVVLLKAIGSKDARPIAILVNYACQPMAAVGKLFGGDYPGFAAQYLEKELPGSMVLFAQGCGADAVPNQPGTPATGGDTKAAERFGRELADAAIDVLGRPMDEITGPIECAMGTAELPLLLEAIDKEGRPAGVGICARKWLPSMSGPLRRGARLAQLTLDAIDEKGGYRRTQPCEINTVKIGDRFVFVGMNGEICSPIGMRVKAQLRGRQVLLAACTGPNIDCIPSSSQLVEGGFEVYRNPAGLPYSLEAEDVLVAKAMELVLA